MINELIDQFIDIVIREDIGDGDHSSRSCIPESAEGKMYLLVKENGILAGVDIAKKIFARIDQNIELDVLIEDGTSVQVGDIVMNVSGRVWSLLQAERLVLNVMQRMSGIATRTAEYVTRLDGTNTRVLDTRKTTPAMRYLEKRSSAIGWWC